MIMICLSLPPEGEELHTKLLRLGLLGESDRLSCQLIF